MASAFPVWPSRTKIARELRRGAEMMRNSGARAAWVFARQELLGNTWLRLSEGMGVPSKRARVQCNVCGWMGTRFLTHCAAGYINLNAFCPRCRSHGRHRGFNWLLEHELSEEFDTLAQGHGRRILFAPEPGLAWVLDRRLGRIEGADLDAGREGVTLVEDLQQLSFPDASIDFAVAFHVLEHVPDDRRALRELARVLTPVGRLLLCVPTSFGRDETVEFGRPLPALNGHWHEYGADFTRRLAAAGLIGRSYRLGRDLPREVFTRLALVDEELHWLRRADAPGP